MPDFTGEITEASLKTTQKAELLKWMVKNAGFWFAMTLKVLGKAKDRKTKEQLGYYWGLLLPETHDQYLRDGMTVTVEVSKIKVHGKPLHVERKPTMDDSHELNKDICALIGDNGAWMNVREMDKQQVRKFIDNVLNHASQNLLMNGEELEARRPGE